MDKVGYYLHIWVGEAGGGEIEGTAPGMDKNASRVMRQAGQNGGV